MASNLRVDTILPSTGLTLGIGTASGTINFLGNSNIVTTGNVSIGGTLTYEDVTNVDSVGVITARSGIDAPSNLLLKTGGTERLRITSDGKIGINNDTPIHTVHIKSVMASSPSYIHMTSTGSNVNGGGGGIAFDTSATNTDETKYLATIAGIRNTEGNGSNDLVFSTTKMGVSGGAPTEKLRIGSSGQFGISGANYGTAGQFLQSQGASSAVQWATVSTDQEFAQWRVTSNWSGNTDPITNFSEKEHNVDMGYSSGIFSFPTTGFWEIMFQAYCYHNSDQDNIELHIVTTTNNSSYTTRMRSYAHMNNDDGGNLYATVQGTYIFDVTDTSNCKVKFKTAGTSATFQTSSSSNESYAIFKRLAAT